MRHVGGQVDMRENEYQGHLIKRIEKTFVGSIVLKNDPNYKQGIPDLTIFYKDKWATLEVKKSKNASHQPNQDYYVELMNQMSYSAFIYPDNEEEILDEMARTLSIVGETRILKSKSKSLG